MSDAITDYGFRWGPIEVTRCATVGRGTRVIEVGVNDAKRLLTIYVSPTGRSVRVFRDGVELVRDASQQAPGNDGGVS